MSLDSAPLTEHRPFVTSLNERSVINILDLPPPSNSHHQDYYFFDKHLNSVID